MSKRFAIVYDGGAVVRGGGPQEEMVPVTFMVPRTWLDAPVDGVQAVIVDDSDVVRTWRGENFYFPLPCGTEFHSDDTLGAYMRKRLRFIKHGLCLNESEWRQANLLTNKIQKEIRSDWST